MSAANQFYLTFDYANNEYVYATGACVAQADTFGTS
jgi:hypothetical protein